MVIAESEYRRTPPTVERVESIGSLSLDYKGWGYWLLMINEPRAGEIMRENRFPRNISIVDFTYIPPIHEVQTIFDQVRTRFVPTEKVWGVSRVEETWLIGINFLRVWRETDILRQHQDDRILEFAHRIDEIVCQSMNRCLFEERVGSIHPIINWFKRVALPLSPTPLPNCVPMAEPDLYPFLYDPDDRKEPLIMARIQKGKNS